MAYSKPCYKPCSISHFQIKTLKQICTIRPILLLADLIVEPFDFVATSYASCLKKSVLKNERRQIPTLVKKNMLSYIVEY